MEKTAVLLTCHNRKEKTINCLISLYKSIESTVSDMLFEIYLVDDGSTDGTSQEVALRFSGVNIIKGSGNLFWAQGMRLAWETALNRNQHYDFFLLLNDDVILVENFITDLLTTHAYCMKTFHRSGIYVSSTKDFTNLKTSYGGLQIKYKGIKISTIKINPSNVPQRCTITNANILLVTKDVVKSIGILDSNYIHQFADYDYSLTASRKGIPVLVCPGFGGVCTNDHGKSWKSSDFTLKERLNYLYSPTGLAYKEQIYYLKKNFKFQFPYYFTMLWLKTVFPFIWDNLKKESLND